MKSLSRIKEELKYTRYFTYIFVSVWKIVAFFCCVILILWIQGESLADFFGLFSTGFGPHNIIVEEVINNIANFV